MCIFQLFLLFLNYSISKRQAGYWYKCDEAVCSKQHPCLKCQEKTLGVKHRSSCGLVLVNMSRRALNKEAMPIAICHIVSWQASPRCFPYTIAARVKLHAMRDTAVGVRFAYIGQVSWDYTTPGSRPASKALPYQTPR